MPIIFRNAHAKDLEKKNENKKKRFCEIESICQIVDEAKKKGWNIKSRTGFHNEIFPHIFRTATEKTSGPVSPSTQEINRYKRLLRRLTTEGIKKRECSQKRKKNTVTKKCGSILLAAIDKRHKRQRWKLEVLSTHYNGGVKNRGMKRKQKRMRKSRLSFEGNVASAPLCHAANPEIDLSEPILSFAPQVFPRRIQDVKQAPTLPNRCR